MGAAFTFIVLDYSLENFMRLFFISSHDRATGKYFVIVTLVHIFNDTVSARDIRLP